VDEGDTVGGVRFLSDQGRIKLLLQVPPNHGAGLGWPVLHLPPQSVSVTRQDAVPAAAVKTDLLSRFRPRNKNEPWESKPVKCPSLALLWFALGFGLAWVLLIWDITRSR